LNFKIEQNNNIGVELQNMNPNNVGKYKLTNSHKLITAIFKKSIVFLKIAVISEVKVEIPQVLYC